jgi:hypothetical protein
VTPPKLLAAVAAFTGALACGGDSAELDTTFRTSLDTSKPIGALTDAERSGLCRDTQTWAERVYAFDRLREPLCRRWAVSAAVLMPTTTDAALETTCQSTYAHCLMQPPSDLGATPSCVNASSSCVAEVGQFVRCVNDLEATFTAVLAAVKPCTGLTATSVAAVPAMNVEIPRSCKALFMKCPDVPLPWPPAVRWTSSP